MSHPINAATTTTTTTTTTTAIITTTTIITTNRVSKIICLNLGGAKLESLYRVIGHRKFMGPNMKIAFFAPFIRFKKKLKNNFRY